VKNSGGHLEKVISEHLGVNQSPIEHKKNKSKTENEQNVGYSHRTMFVVYGISRHQNILIAEN
jgi:hypothetical protein